MFVDGQASVSAINEQAVSASSAPAAREDTPAAAPRRSPVLDLSPRRPPVLDLSPSAAVISLAAEAPATDETSLAAEEDGLRAAVDSSTAGRAWQRGAEDVVLDTQAVQVGTEALGGMSDQAVQAHISSHADSVGAASEPAPGESCAASCRGRSCDYWVQGGYGCDELASDYQCDCGGCSLCLPTPAQDSVDAASMPALGESCAATCRGKTCDYWVQGGYACDELVIDYQCDCRGCSLCRPTPARSSARFYMGSLGTECAENELILSWQVCEQAIQQLGTALGPGREPVLKGSMTWTGTYSRIPRGCSLKTDPRQNREDPHHMHFNNATRGQGRGDLQPVCYLKTEGLGRAGSWPRVLPGPPAATPARAASSQAMPRGSLQLDERVEGNNLDGLLPASKSVDPSSLSGPGAA